MTRNSEHAASSARFTVGSRYGLEALLVVGLMAALLSYGTTPLHHDPSMILVGTRRWLDGATLYRDIMEINPPWIFYVSAPPVILAQLFNLPPSATYVAFVLVLAGASLIWCWYLLARIPGLAFGGRCFSITACFAAIVVIPAYEFGQREHVFLTLALPYFIAQSFSPTGLRVPAFEKLVLGLVAACGIVLKPHFVFPGLLLVATLCLQQRSYRPLLDFSNITIAVSLAAYAILVAVAHTEYLTVILPIGVQVYSSISDGAYTITSRAVEPLIFVIAAATIGATSPPLRDSLMAMSGMMIGFILTFIIQLKGWEYHLLPFECAALPLAALSLSLSSHRFRTRPLHLLVIVLVPAVLVTRAAYYGAYTNIYRDTLERELKDSEVDLRGKSILAFTTDVGGAFPLINETGARWVGRYPYQWIIAGAMARKAGPECSEGRSTCSELDDLLQYARRTNVDDLVNNSPDAIIVDASPLKSFFPPAPFDYVEFLGKDPRFFAAWTQYTKVADAFGYEVWIRGDPGTARAQR
jgi:hypothetical protein